MARRVLVDTSSIVSGLFFRHGNERRLLQAILDGHVTMVLPDDVAEETSYVVARRFAGHPERDAAEALLRGLLSIAERAPAEAGTPHLAEAERLIRDRSDAPVLAAALASRPDVLVTGDKDFHAIADKLPFEVLTTREALKRLGLG